MRVAKMLTLLLHVVAKMSVDDIQTITLTRALISFSEENDTTDAFMVRLLVSGSF